MVSFPAKFIAGGLVLGTKWGLSCPRNIILSEMVFWGVLHFHGVLIFKVFNLCIENFLTAIL